ncbi:DUF4189 domain-containing protein [Stenotrophomonas bentonitica]|uniref:DUF4189 domain-containing protein n=1 Tax=Stenotrophomonas bentonitica TaxID=1450134 RepID=UPI00345EE9B3
MNEGRQYMSNRKVAALCMLMMSTMLPGALAVFPLEAQAEGRCPPGQYPVGGQGVGGCAPIPAGGSGDQAPVPTGRWIKTWGAVASSGSGDAGASKGKFSKSEASKDAIAQCAQWGATDCKVTLTYKNSCVAVIQGQKGLGGKVSTAADEQTAIERATDQCKESGSASCKVLYSACTDPYFEKY